jgi:hypothetical protein
MGQLAPTRHGGGGGGAVSLRAVCALCALALVGVTVSSVRFLAATIATSHHATLHDPSLSFEHDSYWHTFNQHVYAHLAQARPGADPRLYRCIHVNLHFFLDFILILPLAVLFTPRP